MTMAGRVAGKAALMTGGGSGIGRAAAMLLAREGARVVVTDIDAVSAGETAAMIEAAGGVALALAHDVADEGSWEAVMRRAIDAFGRIDILVNNAGVAPAGRERVADLTLAEWRRNMAVNLDGVFLGVRAGVRAMSDGGGGAIVNVSSIFGLVGAASIAAYGAAKGGVRLLTKAVAVECGEAGLNIRVNSVHPGYIETPMLAGHVEGEAVRRKVAALHPLGRIGAADDIAAAILYLASDEAKFVTGAELAVDGGYTAR